MKMLAAFLLMLLAGPAGAGADFDLQGHRGARGLAPENTLPAFARALSLGVTTLEMDVRVTRDGVMVIAHDAALNPDFTRAADGRWLEARGPLVRELPFAQLQRYDVGRARPNGPYAGAWPDREALDGTRIPRLADVFGLVRRASNAEVRFNIETKLDPAHPEQSPTPEALARQLVSEVRAADMASRTTIQSFDWRALQVVQREAPEIATVYLTAQQKFLDNVCSGVAARGPTVDAKECGASQWTAGFQLRDHGSVARMVKAAGGSAWSPYFGDVDAAKVAEAHALGLRVVVWTVNAPAQIEAMLDLGVDGIISDRPDRVRSAMERRGLPLPRATPVAP